jgi:DNA-binding MarR family transcriptional regulator
MPGPASPARRFDSPQQEVFLNLWRTYDRLRLLEDALFEMVGLTAQQYNVLRLLKAAGPRGLPTLELAARLVSRAPDITRMLDKLEVRGLVRRRRPQQNRRVVLSALAAPGAALLRRLDKPVRECHAAQLGHLDAPSLGRLCELLYKARAPHEPADSPWL